MAIDFNRLRAFEMYKPHSKRFAGITKTVIPSPF